MAPTRHVGRSRGDRTRSPGGRAPGELECPQNAAGHPPAAGHHPGRSDHTAPRPGPRHVATVRDNPIVAGQVDYLGVVGTKYEPVQNEASCAVLDAITDEAGAHFETARALKGGRETFITMKLPKTMTFACRDGSADTTEWYLAALNSHDG
jgi:hypothetical protein